MMFSIFLMFFSAVASAQTPSVDDFWEALQENDLQTVKSLLASGVSPDTEFKTDTALTYSLKHDSLDMTRLLLEHHANPDLVQPISQFTPLIVAAKYNQADALSLLLDYHANVNFTGVFGRGPLHVAALHHSLDAARVLLQKTDIDVNARGSLCPLAVASRQGHLDFVQLLIQESKKAFSKKCIDSSKSMADYNHHSEVLKLLETI